MGYDLAVALRLLERKHAGVLSVVTIHYDRDVSNGPAAFAECWAPYNLGDGREDFEVRFNRDQRETRFEVWDAALIHELVHVAQIERYGAVGATGSGEWSSQWWPTMQAARSARAPLPHGDEPEWDAYTGREYRRFWYERQAQKIALELAGSPRSREVYEDALAIAAGRLAPRWRP